MPRAQEYRLVEFVVLGGGAPYAGLAVFGHGVTARDLNFGGFTVGIAFGYFHDRKLRVRMKEEGHRPGVKVQVTQNAGQPSNVKTILGRKFLNIHRQMLPKKSPPAEDLLST